MELHKNTVNTFIQYLIQHGYPEDSIVTEWGDKNYRIDVAILDESKSFPVAIYEIKGEKDMNSIIRGLSQLKRYINYLDYSVEAGLVFSKKEAPYFEVYKANDYLDTSDEIEILDEFKDKNDKANTEPKLYKNITRSAESQFEQRQKRVKKKYLDKFKITCCIIGVIILGVILLDALNKYNITTERLIIIGFLVIIGLLPFFSEIKYGDWYLKRFDERESLTKDKKED